MINKPINPYPYNCCVTTSEGVNIKYEIPNEKIDSCTIMINDLDSGNCVLSHHEHFEESTNKVDINIDNSSSQEGKEYSWSSLYWQTPASSGNTRQTAGYEDTKSSLFLRADFGDASLRVDPVYEYGKTIGSLQGYTVDSACVYEYKIYNRTIYTSLCGHTDDEDTSSRCYEGQLTDYFNRIAIFTGWNSASSLGKFIRTELEKGRAPILEFMDDNNKIISCGRIVAWDYADGGIRRDGSGGCLYIVDNVEMGNHIDAAIQSDRIQTPVIYHTLGKLWEEDTFFKIATINLYGGDASAKEENYDQQLMLLNGDYYYIRDSVFENYYYALNVIPPLPKTYPGEVVELYDKTNTEFNISPAYYFRYKSVPQVAVDDFSQLQTEDETNILKDVKCKFGITYSSSNCRLNYFYLYLYVFNSRTSRWELQERTPMLYDSEDAYEFIGLYHEQKYKVFAVCTDKDGDEWTSQELQFTIDNPAIPVSFTAYDIQVIFNRVSTTIDVSLEKYLTYYKNVTLEFYKDIRNDMGVETRLTYAGGGIAKIEGNVVFNRWSDYNICNDTYYDYYIRVDYQKHDGTSGLEWLWIANNVHTEFCGTSILGLEKVNDNQLEIVNSFNILYQFDKDMGELNNQLSREYMNSFGKYPKELKGHQNYISSSVSGLLGDECKGIYVEPNGIRKAWNKFVDDDTIKLYRGFDGETMIISIDTNRVKPFYYSNVGIVNEVSITFKEIASASQYAIFSTAGD